MAYKEHGSTLLSREARDLYAESAGRAPWRPKADRCPDCGYRLDAPGHANSIHPEGAV